MLVSTAGLIVNGIGGNWLKPYPVNIDLISFFDSLERIKPPRNPNRRFLWVGGRDNRFLEGDNRPFGYWRIKRIDPRRPYWRSNELGTFVWLEFSVGSDGVDYSLSCGPPAISVSLFLRYG